MTNHLTESITTFLRSFERADTPEELTALAECYAETFLVAGPDGTTAVKRGDFALALPRRKKMFDEMGLRSTKLNSAVVTSLDERYAMAQTTWKWNLVRGEGPISEIEAKSTFIVDTKDELRIVLYLSHQDIGTVLRERGVL